MNVFEIVMAEAEQSSGRRELLVVKFWIDVSLMLGLI